MRIKNLLRVVGLGLGLTLTLLAVLSSTQTARAWPPDPPRSGPAFVKPGGAGASCLQAAPCGSIQYAIDNAEPGNGDTVYIAAGTYTGTGAAVITITKNITLYGGWDGAGSGQVARNPAVHITTLSGEGARRVVFINGNITVVIDGLTVTQGLDNSRGAGLYAQGANLTLKGVVVSDNVLTNTLGLDAYGGGACVMKGTFHAASSTFRDNDAWCSGCAETRGGGLYISGTVAATIEDSLFEGNDAYLGSGLEFYGTLSKRPILVRRTVFQNNGAGSAPGSGYGAYGGGAYLHLASSQLEDNTWLHNAASNEGGALFFSSGLFRLERSLIMNNQANSTGAGVLVQNSAPFTLTNNVIADNTPGYAEGAGGVHLRSAAGSLLHNSLARNVGLSGGYGIKAQTSVAELKNTILVGHSVGISVTGGSTTLAGTLWGAGSWANGQEWGGAGTVHTSLDVRGDPAFVNPTGGDYHINMTSAALDAGVQTGVTQDMDGERRPIGRPDIGADERGGRVYLPLMLKSKT